MRTLSAFALGFALGLPATASAKGEHVAMICAFGADPFCDRLLAELVSAGHKVDSLPDQADLDAELGAPGAVVQVRQSPWEVTVWIRHDGKLETRSFAPNPKEPNPARIVALQVVECMRASFLTAEIKPVAKVAKPAMKAEKPSPPPKAKK